MMMPLKTAQGIDHAHLAEDRARVVAVVATILAVVAT